MPRPRPAKRKKPRHSGLDPKSSAVYSSGEAVARIFVFYPINLTIKEFFQNIALLLPPSSRGDRPNTKIR
jgi:hypothetical protein